MDPAMAPPINERLDRSCADAMAPWNSGRQFVNFADRGGSAEPAYDTETYARLRAVRGTVRPRRTVRRHAADRAVYSVKRPLRMRSASISTSSWAPDTTTSGSGTKSISRVAARRSRRR